MWLESRVSRGDVPTCSVDVLLAGVPDAGVEAAEQEAVVPGLPAVVHLALVRLVHAVVDAVVAPLLAAVRLGDALGALAPVGGDEGGGGEQQSRQVQTHRQQRATFPRRLHGFPPEPRGAGRSAERRHGAAALRAAPSCGSVLSKMTAVLCPSAPLLSQRRRSEAASGTPLFLSL